MPARLTLPDLSRPVLIGHRGMGVSRHASPGNPHTENTRASFIAAHHAGATWIELDLVPSADGDLMMFHDHFIARNGIVVPVWEVPTRELVAQGIERLDGLCDDLPDGLGLYLEAKVSPGDADPTAGPPSLGLLASWMRAHAPHRPLLAASFNPYVVEDLHHDGLPAAWITDRTQPLHASITAAVRANIPVLVVHGDTLDAPEHEISFAIQMAHRNALTLWSWSPQTGRIPRYLHLGITGFCVDDVPGAVAVLARSAC